MSLFAYKAVDPNGRTVSGQIDALNVADLEMRLKRMELDLIRGAPVSDRRLFRGDRVPRRELIHFCFHLELLLRAGVPILEGLSDLRDTLEHPRFREIVAGLIESIEGGRRLSQAMLEHPKVFSRVFVSLIRAGEATGRLPEILRGLTEALKWEDEFSAQTRKLLIYPAFVATIIVAATIFLLVYMVPQLKLFMRNMGQALPIETRILFFVSDFLVAHWAAALLAPVVLAFGFRLLLQFSGASRQAFDEFKLRLPVIGNIWRKIILSRFTSTLALLYSSGIPVIEAVQITQDVVGNRVVRDKLKRIEQLISQGQNVTNAFHSVGFFPPLVVRMLRIGESTGALDAALINASYFYDRDVKESVARMQQMIEPTLTVLLGGLLGWIMLSVLGPIYDVISQIKT